MGVDPFASMGPSLYKHRKAAADVGYDGREIIATWKAFHAPI